MSQHKNIYWRKDMEPNANGEVFANIHLLIGYNQGYITDFQKMADILRETFPQATNDQIHCGKVVKSSYVKGFSIISWNTHVPKRDYLGWSQYEDGSIDYTWS